MLRAEPAEFLFLSFTCDILGYTLVANDAKLVHFTFYVYFLGHWATMLFEGYGGATPRHAPVRSGAEREVA